MGSSPALRCAACTTSVEPFFGLGAQPLANGFLSTADLAHDEPRHQLGVAFCPRCSLVQLVHTIDPAILYTADYPYLTGCSPPMASAWRFLTGRLMAERHPLAVVDIGSNDGTLLTHYRVRGVHVTGIDPSASAASRAESHGIHTVVDFFGRRLARELLAHQGPADIIHASNVLAHSPDLYDFVGGLSTLLAPTGVAVIEVPYVRALIDSLAFDTIYHEHVYYFSLSSLAALVRAHGLVLRDVDLTDLHGGSLRAFVERSGKPSARVHEVLRAEDAIGLTRFDYYQNFAHRVEELRDHLRALLNGVEVVGFGAAAKATVLLNYCDIGPMMLQYVADETPTKVGRYIPGIRIPIVSVTDLIADAPEHVLVLCWNFARDVIPHLRDLGYKGRFILPSPVPCVLASDDDFPVASAPDGGTLTETARRGRDL